jgi:hypothetical protein
MTDTPKPAASAARISEEHHKATIHLQTQLLDELRQLNELNRKVHTQPPLKSREIWIFLLQFFGLIAGFTFGVFAILAWMSAEKANRDSTLANDLASAANEMGSQANIMASRANEVASLGLDVALTARADAMVGNVMAIWARCETMPAPTATEVSADPFCLSHCRSLPWVVLLHVADLLTGAVTR